MGLGARLVDPASSAASGSSPVAGKAGGQGDFVRGDDPLAHARWIEAHRKFEASSRSEAPPELLEALRGPRETRRALARDLGRRLGAILFERVRSGKLGPRELTRLFSRKLEAQQAQRVVLSLLRGDSRA